ncbi:MAG: L-2-amino-thiazoline-4-carboxylic acid hydrolase [Maledivibacter sp.]|jgi:hypothetical protein|nr:L-2-amino-thiazoline-4-carboxylic acid hydrolase [Maledivibacter sp.]
MVKYMENYIINNFDEKIAKFICENTDDQLTKLKENCMEESKNRRGNLFKSIFPAIALYRVLQIQMSREEAFEHMKKMISDNTKKNSRKVYERMGKLPFFFSLFRKMFTMGLKGDSWDVEWVENNKSNFEYNIKGCLWNDAFKRYDCHELCALFCNNDEINFTNVSPKMHFERKYALGYGDHMCDFHFYAMKKNKTASK